MKKNEKKPKKKKDKHDNLEESARFLEKAKEIQAEDGKEKFDEACNTILTRKPYR
jgi:hypothetical protein